MKRIFLSFLWCACVLGMQEPFTPSIQKALLEIAQEKKINAWKHFREEQVFVKKHVEGVPCAPIKNHGIQLFEATYTECFCNRSPLMKFDQSYFAFHDDILKMEYYLGNVTIYDQQDNLEFQCSDKKSFGKKNEYGFFIYDPILVKEKYYIDIEKNNVGRTIGVVAFTDEPLENMCDLGYIFGMEGDTEYGIDEMSHAWYQTYSPVYCMPRQGKSSFDIENNMFVMFMSGKGKYDLVLCQLNPCRVITILKQENKNMHDSDIIMRNNVVMMVTTHGNVTQFYPYDPTYFELHPEKITRGCDAFFDYN